MTCLLLLGHGAKLAQTVDNGNDQTAKTDASKAVRQGAFERAPSSAPGEVVLAEVPRAIYSRNSGVDRVLEPFGDPVGCESDEDQQPNDLALATTTSTGAAGRVVAWLVLDIHRNQGN